MFTQAYWAVGDYSISETVQLDKFDKYFILINEIFTPSQLPNALYHATIDANAIDILRQGKFLASEDAWGKTDSSFVSTTIDPKLKFSGGAPNTANIQFVLNKSYFEKKNDYKIEIWDDWDEVRILMPNNTDYIPINSKSVIFIIIEQKDTKFFKNWRQHKNINFDRLAGEKKL